MRLTAGALAFCVTLAQPLSAQEWPARPVRILNSFAPGGAADFLARIVADHLSATFKQQFFVEGRPGAGGAIAVQAVATAEPDGYNFVITTVSLLSILPVMNPRIGYDPVKDLTNVAYIAGSPIIFTVNPSSGIKTLADFVALGRRGKALSYSSSGVGSNGQLVAEIFSQLASIKVEHVPYKGASQGLMDLVGGHIDFASQTLSSSSGQIRGGGLFPLVHSADTRLPEYPDVPTFKEGGYDIATSNWFALSGPPRLPRDIAGKVNRAVVDAMQKPDVQQKLRSDGLVSQALGLDAFGSFVAAESARWKPVVERAGLAGK
ncbi:MAG: tripartite tricarboxylate transporter substrate binding protein [Hyphomicrobiales bacterium]|nr:tripartite tricarboxylate transporter substrate binding protein [Hyphomicrobiales bacterium]